MKRRRYSVKRKIEFVRDVMEEAEAIILTYATGNTAQAEKKIDELVTLAEETLWFCSPVLSRKRFATERYGL